jgi:uncharacterized membrane protein
LSHFRRASDDALGFFIRLPDGQSEHAVAWLFGRVFDLGTLGGPNSDVAWSAKSSYAIGISGECDQAVGRRTAKHAVLWEDGKAVEIGKGQLPAAWWNPAQPDGS